MKNVFGKVGQNGWNVSFVGDVSFNLRNALQMLNTQNDGPIKGNGRVTEVGFEYSFCRPIIMSKYEIFTAV